LGVHPHPLATMWQRHWVEPRKKITKENRVWDDHLESQKLDFTNPTSENGEGNMVVVAAYQGESMMDKEEIFSSDSEEDDEAEKDRKVDAKKKGWFSSMFQTNVFHIP